MIHKLSYIHWYLLIILFISTNAIRKSNFKLKYGNSRILDVDYNSETAGDDDKNAEQILGSGARLVDWGGNFYVLQKFGEQSTINNDSNENEKHDELRSDNNLNNEPPNPYDADPNQKEEHSNKNTESKPDINTGNITQLLLFNKPVRAYPIDVSNDGKGYVYIPATNKRGLYVIGQPVVQPKKILVQSSEVEEPRINSDYPFNSFYNRLPRLSTDQA